jgi:hypothetical protein
MRFEPLPRPLRWLLHACLATLFAVGLADLLVRLVEPYEPTLSASTPAGFAAFIYPFYLWLALGLGLVFGLLLYIEGCDRLVPRSSW